MNTIQYHIGEVIAFNHYEKNGQTEKLGLVISMSEDGHTIMIALILMETEHTQKNKLLISLTKNKFETGSLNGNFVIDCNLLNTITTGDITKSKIAKLKKVTLKEVFTKISKISVQGIFETIHENRERVFEPGKSRVNYAGRVFDESEIGNAVEASLDFWLTEGRFSEAFSEKISEFLDIEHVLLTNSGSSANLLAFSALTSEKLGDKRLKPGDEVISVAAGFPATVTPIIQNGLIPVFVDVILPTYNIDTEQLKKAISPKTRCIFIAHTLGNPFNLEAVMEIAKAYDLWVIEDNCDAFGSTYKGKYTGIFGHLSTISFYPAHHITTGEGGAICTNDPMLAQLVRAFRDWGRDCYCAGGENNTCGKRFTQKYGNLPLGYDHKYVYSEIGYNLKMTDIQAAIGAAQMDKLPEFCERRKENFNAYNKIFEKYPEHFILPEATPNSDPSWFAYIVTLKKGLSFTREDLTGYLNQRLIETRTLFAGNMVKQPAFMNKKYKIASGLEVTNYIMNNTFFLGTYPGLTKEKLQYIEEVMDEFMRGVG